MHLVFVYGSLKRGLCNHHFLQHGQFMGEWKTDAIYALVDLGAYPGLVSGQRSIVGEVFAVDDATLAQLDLLEGVPDFYQRHRQDTPWGQAWIYIYQNQPPNPPGKPWPHDVWFEIADGNLQ